MVKALSMQIEMCLDEVNIKLKTVQKELVLYYMDPGFFGGVGGRTC